jgi:hypothetical protein
MDILNFRDSEDIDIIYIFMGSSLHIVIERQTTFPLRPLPRWFLPASLAGYSVPVDL